MHVGPVYSCSDLAEAIIFYNFESADSGKIVFIEASLDQNRKWFGTSRFSVRSPIIGKGNLDFFDEGRRLEREQDPVLASQCSI
jgi:hypothetical protein